MAERAAIILAAGISSRMNADIPKVLHEVCGRPMLSYVLDACRQAGVGRLYVVVGFCAEQVKKQFGQAEDIFWVLQPEQKGTAHAVMCCREHLGNFEGQTFVLCGDGPLIRPEILRTLMEEHEEQHSAAALATAVLDDPTGYGRIVRDAAGNICGIVEHNDCTSKQLKIREVNPSYYLFDNRVLFEAIEKVRPDNAKNEYYLTDVISVMIEAGQKVSAVTAVRPEEAMSANDPEQLRQMVRVMEQRFENGRLDVQARPQGSANE
ncbi:MAG: NTP transferase domain-containing protein [Planctomycetota bacterium]|jgi:bifunctional UDP-N-acetylglucosamine pyrophosphorylase/glucosamine-1-phosphate N-acetyltransferase